MHLAYQRWAQECTSREGEAEVSSYTHSNKLILGLDGPIFSLKLGQQTLIVLTSGEMIKKLINKRSGNYADQQQLYMREPYEDSRIILRG